MFADLAPRLAMRDSRSSRLPPSTTAQCVGAAEDSALQHNSARSSGPRDSRARIRRRGASDRPPCGLDLQAKTGRWRRSRGDGRDESEPGPNHFRVKEYHCAAVSNEARADRTTLPRRLRPELRLAIAFSGTKWREDTMRSRQSNRRVRAPETIPRAAAETRSETF